MANTVGLGEYTDEDLIEELHNRGYNITEDYTIDN
jgi:hypothetical protein